MSWYDPPVSFIKRHPVPFGIIAFFLALFLLATLFVLANDLGEFLKGA